MRFNNKKLLLPLAISMALYGAQAVAAENDDDDDNNDTD